MENKKIKNATGVIYDNIHFKSNLEVYMYKCLLNLDVDFSYEKVSFDIIPKTIIGNSMVYYPNSTGKNKSSLIKRCTINKKTYTPDFVVEVSNFIIIIECKGFSNDDYPTKRKLFLIMLDKMFDGTDITPVFLEPHNNKQVNESIEIIKNLKNL